MLEQQLDRIVVVIVDGKVKRCFSTVLVHQLFVVDAVVRVPAVFEEQFHRVVVVGAVFQAGNDWTQARFFVNSTLSQVGNALDFSFKKT